MRYRAAFVLKYIISFNLLKIIFRLILCLRLQFLILLDINLSESFGQSTSVFDENFFSQIKLKSNLRHLNSTVYEWLWIVVKITYYGLQYTKPSAFRVPDDDIKTCPKLIEILFLTDCQPATIPWLPSCNFSSHRCRSI